MRSQRERRGRQDESSQEREGEERHEKRRGSGVKRRSVRWHEHPRREDQPAFSRGRRAAPATRTRMPLEEPPTRAPFRGRGHGAAEHGFKCGHCKRFIGPLPSGGHHRNHCPLCLYSRHVDNRRSGDRASTCGALMAPIGAFQRPNGEHVVVHRCLGCGFERFNRIAADDDFDLVLSLPVMPPRSARRDANDPGIW